LSIALASLALTLMNVDIKFASPSGEGRSNLERCHKEIDVMVILGKVTAETKGFVAVHSLEYIQATGQCVATPDGQLGDPVRCEG
jgi:hypothetical protein